MIDIKEELAKFSQFDLGFEGGQEQPDKNSVDAIVCFNKALDQLDNNLDDMARANLRRAISLQPDFSHAICLLALCLFSKGDRLGVVKLMSSIQNQQVKTEITPYIDYLFNQYDKVEYTKETKKTKSTFAPATARGEASVKLNASSERNNGPFGRTQDNNPFRKSFTEITSSGSADNIATRKPSVNSAPANPFDRSRTKVISTQADDSVEIRRKLSGLSGRDNAEFRGQTEREDFTEAKDGKKANSPKANGNNTSGNASGNVSGGASGSNMKHYSPEEIKKNRILVLTFAAFIIAFIVLIIIITDLASQNKELKRKLSEEYMAAPFSVSDISAGINRY